MFNLNSMRLVAVVGFICFTVAIVVLWRLVPQERSLKDWALATLFIAVSLLLLGLRGVIPNFISITIANTLLTLGIGYIYVGTCNLLGKSVSGFRWIWFATAITFLIGFSQSLSFRISAYSLLDVPFFALCAWLFWRAKGNRQIVVVQRIAAIIFAIGALMFIVRAFKSPPTSAPSINAIAPNWLEVFPYVYAIMFSIWLSTTILLIVSFRLQGQRAEVLRHADLLNQALLESETHLRTIINTEPECIKIINAAGSLTEMNPAGLAMLEADSVEQLSGVKLLNTIKPKYRKAFIDMHKRVLAGEAVQMEFEVVGLKGEHRWLHTSAVPMQAKGQTVLLAVTRDITEQKHNQEELRVAATAFESQVGMIVTDANSIILRVNHAFTSITGYSSEETIGKTPQLLSSGRQDKAFYAEMWARLNQTGAWEGEIWNRRKSGDVYPEHLHITAVKDAAGMVTNYVASLNDITKRHAAADEIKTLAFYDPLTHLPNRRLLNDRLKQALAASSRSGQRGALLFLDLDHFKTLNDTMGHEAGDLLLEQVAERLSANVREGDTVSRLGGDEFVILLKDLSNQSIEAAAQAKAIAQKILFSLSQLYQLGTHRHYSTSSIGVTLFNGHEEEPQDLLKQADIAMYQSKTEGRNTLRFFDPNMQEVINVRADMENELRTAIENNQFQLHYQIQVDHMGQAVGAEVLIRWQHPERGMISPFNFIPLAEETGLILPIGQWVLDTACEQLKLWQQNPLTQDLVLAVNVSAKQFHQVDFTEVVQACLQRHNVIPARLKLELTESMLVININDIIAKMSVLSEMGIRFSLDDFGTGYSSLQYLKKLPIQQLKIDQSFVRDILIDSSDRAIVCTIITMSRNLGIDVIAEGVETLEQRQYLLDKGCMYYQGYLFSKPVPIDEFEALLGES